VIAFGLNGLKENTARARILWIVYRDYNALNTWKALVKLRSICKGLIGRKIKNGDDTQL